MKRIVISKEIYEICKATGEKKGGSRRDWAYNGFIHHFLEFKANESKFRAIKIRNHIPRKEETTLLGLPDDIYEMLYEMASWNGRTLKGQAEYIVLAVNNKNKNDNKKNK